MVWLVGLGMHRSQPLPQHPWETCSPLLSPTVVSSAGTFLALPLPLSSPPGLGWEADELE